MKNRIKKKMDKMKRREILDLLDLAMRKNEGKASVFFDFSGHVNLVNIRIYRDGYPNPLTRDMSCYTDMFSYRNIHFSEMKKELEAL